MYRLFVLVVVFGALLGGGYLASGSVITNADRASRTTICHGKKCTTSTTTTVPTTTTVQTTTVTTTGTTTTTGGGTTFNVPSSVAGDCSTDVTSQLLSWINTVPDNSTLSFGAGACYRIEGVLELRSR